LSRMRRLRRRQ